MNVMFRGVFSVLPTPFNAAGEIDEQSLKKVIDLFLAAGVDGLTALGVTSEVAKLTDSEKRRVLSLIIEHTAGRVPIVAGTTSEGTRTCIEASRAAIADGASAVMVSPPRMSKLNTDAVVRHYKTLSEAVNAPIVVQDYPPVSGYAMEAALLVRISREVPNARAIKLEDAPTPFKIAKIRAIANGEQIAIFGGLGGVYLLEELIAGATGAMTGFAIPEILVHVVKHFHAGNLEEARQMFYRSVPLMRFEFQEGIGMAIRKEILRRRGAIQHAGIRPPGSDLDSATIRALDDLTEWLKQQGCKWL